MEPSKCWRPTCPLLEPSGTPHIPLTRHGENAKQTSLKFPSHVENNFLEVPFVFKDLLYRALRGHGPDIPCGQRARSDTASQSDRRHRRWRRHNNDYSISWGKTFLAAGRHTITWCHTQDNWERKARSTHSGSRVSRAAQYHPR